METEEDGRRFYYTYPVKGKKTKVYCKYDGRKSLETAIMERRTSLRRAIEIYMEEVTWNENIFHSKCPCGIVRLNNL